MVILTVKKGDEPQFLFETTVTKSVDETVKECTEIYNGRLKVSRICFEIEELAKHGTMLPPEILGLTPEQVSELGLQDPWAERCAPAGWVRCPDAVGRRCGRQPGPTLQKVLAAAVEKAREMVSKKLCVAGKALTRSDVSKALSELSGAVTIVYPMGLPSHDPIRQELENVEDLEGTQASLEVLDPATAVMWFCGKQLLAGAALSKQLGRNDKCKVLVKLCKRGEGAPAREPVLTEDDRKHLMMQAYRRQEELKVSASTHLLIHITFTTSLLLSYGVVANGTIKDSEPVDGLLWTSSIPPSLLGPSWPSCWHDFSICEFIYV